MFNRHQETGVKFWAVDGERIYLAWIRETIRASSVCTSRTKVNTAVAIYATLALHAGNTSAAFIYGEVVPLTGSPRN
jgi:hypothetical protein